MWAGEKNLDRGNHSCRDLGTSSLARTAAWMDRSDFPSGPAVKVALQRTHLEVTPEVGFDALRRGDGTGKSGVVRHFMQEGRVPQRPAVSQRGGALGGVENKLHAAVFDG